MENRLKTRISRMVRGSFGLCRAAGNFSDVVEKAVFGHQHQKDYSYNGVVEKARPFPSICRPKCPEATTNYSILPRQKLSGRCPPFLSANFNEQTCPPASPASPFNPFYQEFNLLNKSTKKTKKKIKNNRRDTSLFSSSSQDSAYFETNYWFNSGEDESDTLFSSRSTVSSDCSGRGSLRRRSLRRKYSSRRRRAGGGSSRRSNKSCQMEVLPLQGKVKDSFAVVKSSSDPYNDFRTSMVEMIVEKQIFSAKGLEQLLQCFLSLNSCHHHRTIVEVFTEIYEALFCY